MPPRRKQRSRRALLIHGRRVRISDLIEADLLSPGTELVYQQRMDMRPHRAVVTDDGQLRLPDGRQFETPSAAAAAAANIVAAPGWAVWRVKGRNSPSLHDLRQQLLRTVAEEATQDRTAPTSTVDALRHRLEFLSGAHAAAEAGKPETLTVRALLELWRISERDRAMSVEIDADLANHGLTTAPDFRAVSLDHPVKLVVPHESAEAETSGTLPGGKLPSASSEVNAETSTDIGLVLGHLISEDHPLVSVQPTASFEQAVTAMQLNDYSQLAVLTGERHLHGAVTWKSIAEAKHRDPNASFSAAIDKNVRDFDYNTRLLDVLPTLRSDGFVFVRNFERKVTGIVTNADVVIKYDETATPFFLIGEVDQELRQLVLGNIDEDAAHGACNSAGSPFDSADSMNFGHYQCILSNGACWDQLGWPIDRKMFTSRLDEIRKVRNTVAHFNPDPIKPDQIHKLRQFLKLIRNYNR